MKVFAFSLCSPSAAPDLVLRLPALMLAVLLAGPGRADECDQLPMPSVTVNRLDENITVSNQYSYRELTHLGATLAPAGRQVLGLTRGKAVARFTTRTPLYIDRTGRWECASPQISVSFGLSPMTVYVAKEFREGSCAYREIYQHELRHVKAYRDHLNRIEKEVSDMLNQRFATGGPWRGPAGQAQERLQRELEDRWLPYIRRAINRVDQAQALIDTPEEYARVSNSCNGEISRRTRQ